MVAKTNTASNTLPVAPERLFSETKFTLTTYESTWDGTIRSVSVFKVMVQVVTLLWRSCWHKNAGEVT
jgi:hypothetical protein